MAPFSDNEISFDFILNFKPSIDGINNYSQSMDKLRERVIKNKAEEQKLIENVVKANKIYNQAIGESAKELAHNTIVANTLEKQIKQTFDSDTLDKFITELKQTGGTSLSFETFNELKNNISGAKDEVEALGVLFKALNQESENNINEIENYFKELKAEIVNNEEELKRLKQIAEDTAPGIDGANAYEKQKQKVANLNNSLKETKIDLENAKQEATDFEKEGNSFLSVAGKTQTLRQELRLVSEELQNLQKEGFDETNSERYRELIKRAGELKDIQGDVNQEVKAMGSDTRGFDRVIGLANTAVSTFSLYEGVLALTGQQSEEYEKTMIKLQGAIAVMTSLQQIQAQLTDRSTLLFKLKTKALQLHAVATNTSASAMTRLRAVLVASGIGALVVLLGYLVSNWDKVSKAIGLTSEKAERNNAINAKANEIAGEQIAKLSILIDRVKKGGLSFQEKQKAVHDYNKEFGETLGTIKDYTELEKRLIENGDDYITYLGLKAQAEAAYQLAIEKSKEALLRKNNVETSFLQDYGRVKVKSIFGGIPTSFEFISPEENAKKRAEQESKEILDESKKFLTENEKLTQQAQLLANKLKLPPPKFDKEVATKTIQDYSSFIDELKGKIRELANANNENEYQKRLNAIDIAFESEKEKYKKQIQAIKDNDKQKAELQKLFNKLYNEELGKEGEAVKNRNNEKKKLVEEFEKQRAEIIIKAETVILSAYGKNTETELQNIRIKYEEIRKELAEQIRLTNDATAKAQLEAQLNQLPEAQQQEERNLSFNTNKGVIESQKNINESLLGIVLEGENERKTALNSLQTSNYQQQLQNFKTLLAEPLQAQYTALVDELAKTNSPERAEEIADQLTQMFGQERATEIINLIGQTKNLKNELGKPFEINLDLGAFSGLADKLEKELSKIKGITGDVAKAISQGVAFTLSNTFDALSQGIENTIKLHEERLEILDEQINKVESDLNKEKELQDEGLANNYDAKKQELEDLKQAKADEEAEMQRSLQKKQQLQKAEFLIDTAMQLSNLITASTKIFNSVASIPFAGIPIAIGLITAMFGAFAAAKITAYQAISQGTQYREGIKRGKVSLQGPSHEQGGFGLYNNQTGKQVAEFEGNEDVYVFNPQQKQKYAPILEALLNDAKGYMSIDSTLDSLQKVNTKNQVKGAINMYNIAVQGKSNEIKQLTDDVRELKSMFALEFSGYKQEREETERQFETNDFFIVKSKNKTTKIRKNNG